MKNTNNTDKNTDRFDDIIKALLIIGIFLIAIIAGGMVDTEFINAGLIP